MTSSMGSGMPHAGTHDGWRDALAVPAETETIPRRFRHARKPPKIDREEW